MVGNFQVREPLELGGRRLTILAWLGFPTLQYRQRMLAPFGIGVGNAVHPFELLLHFAVLTCDISE